MTSASKQLAAQGAALNDRREERLIQWQVEMFIRLLKKIVAAREESPQYDEEEEEKKEANEEITQPIEEIPGPPEPRDPEPPSPAIDRFSLKQHFLVRSQSRLGGAGVLGTPVRQPSFRLPTRRASLDIDNMSASFSTAMTNDGDPVENVIDDSSTAMTIDGDPDKLVCDEVAEIITLPKFNSQAIKALAAAEAMELGEAVTSQLEDYIKTIAHMYRQNPFHNFEHASHVTMSANKLLNRKFYSSMPLLLLLASCPYLFLPIHRYCHPRKC
jgi:hypothetical protein